MKRKNIILSLILVFIFTINVILIAQSVNGAAPSNYTITCYGYVKDYNTDATISGATVRLSEAESGISSTTTTKGGYYSISISVPFYFKFTLKVTMTGYNDAAAYFYSAGSYRKDVYLQPAGLHVMTCIGQIKDAFTTNPINSATVKLINPVTGSILKSTTSNSFGDYYLSLSTADYSYYSLSVSKAGYLPQTKIVYSEGNNFIDFNLLKIRNCYCSGYLYIDDSTTVTLAGATMKLYSPTGTLLTTTTTSESGFFSILGSAAEAGNFRLQMSKTDYETTSLYYGDGYNTNIDAHIMPIDSTSDKLAFFFYNSEVNFGNCVQSYANIMANEGFTTFLYENTNITSKLLQDIDIMEGPSDYVFLFFDGHGYYLDGHSHIRLSPSEYYSSELLAIYVDLFESTNIFILVEACYSGGFVDDLSAPNRFVISSTDQDSPSWFFAYFSFKFFSAISLGCSDFNAYLFALYYAERVTFTLQDPMYNDQLPYTWFTDW